VLALFEGRPLPPKEVSPPNIRRKKTMKSLPAPQKQSAPAELVPAGFLGVYNERESEPMVSLLSEHPSEEDLEEYLFSRLRASQCHTIEFHLQHCDSCYERLIDVAEFIGMMRKAIADALLCKIGRE
jgi:hypothetical protein